MIQQDRRCGTCRWLHVHPDADGKVRVRKDRAYPCCLPIIWPPKCLPDSVTHAYGFLKYPPEKRMLPSAGTTCPTWEARNASS